MNNVIMWVIVGLIIAAALAFVIYKAITIIKMSPEERRETLVGYLSGLVALAENEIGAGHGADKLALVTEWFGKKAPWIYKIILSLFGKENLKDLIEDALNMIEDNFGKKKKD